MKLGCRGRPILVASKSSFWDGEHDRVNGDESASARAQLLDQLFETESPGEYRHRA